MVFLPFPLLWTQAFSSQLSACLLAGRGVGAPGLREQGIGTREQKDTLVGIPGLPPFHDEGEKDGAHGIALSSRPHPALCFHQVGEDVVDAGEVALAF
jgi:hypothetical protein